MDDKDEIISKPKKDNNQLKGGEAFLGVLKDEEEKKEEEMEQKMREEKEFKKFNTDLEEEEIKQEEEIMKDEIIIKEDEKIPKKLSKPKNELILNEIEEDESKKVYKINNIREIKEVIIHNTKNPPPTRCYLTSEYSPKLKKIIYLGGSDINSEQYSKIDLYDPNKHRWENYPHHFEIFNRQLSGQSSNLVNISVNNINDQERKTEKNIFAGASGVYSDHGGHRTCLHLCDLLQQNSERKHGAYHPRGSPDSELASPLSDRRPCSRT